MSVTTKLEKQEVILLKRLSAKADREIETATMTFDNIRHDWNAALPLHEDLLHEVKQAFATAKEFAEEFEAIDAKYSGENLSTELDKRFTEWRDFAKNNLKEITSIRSKIHKMLQEHARHKSSSPESTANGNGNTNGNPTTTTVTKDQKPKILEINAGPSLTKNWLLSMKAYCRAANMDNERTVLNMINNVDNTFQSAITNEIGDYDEATRYPAFDLADGPDDHDKTLQDVILEISKRNTDLLQRRLTYLELPWHKGTTWADQFNIMRRMGNDADLDTFTKEEIHLTKALATCTFELRKDFMRLPKEQRTLQAFGEMAQRVEASASLNRFIANKDVKELNGIKTKTTYQKNKDSYRSYNSNNRPPNNSYSHNNSNNQPPGTSNNASNSNQNNFNQPRCHWCGHEEVHTKANRQEKCMAWNVTCHACGFKGHFQNSSACRNNKKNANAVRRARRKRSRIKPNSMHIRVTLKDAEHGQHAKDIPAKEILALADTGAEDSLLDASQANHLNIDRTYRPWIQVANGYSIRTDGTVTINVNHNGHVTKITPLVVRGLGESLYIGCEDLKKMRILPESFPHCFFPQPQENDQEQGHDTGQNQRGKARIKTIGAIRTLNSR